MASREIVVTNLECEEGEIREETKMKDVEPARSADEHEGNVIDFDEMNIDDLPDFDLDF